MNSIKWWSSSNFSPKAGNVTISLGLVGVKVVQKGVGMQKTENHNFHEISCFSWESWKLMKFMKFHDFSENNENPP